MLIEFSCGTCVNHRRTSEGDATSAPASGADLLSSKWKTSIPSARAEVAEDEARQYSRAKAVQLIDQIGDRLFE